MPKQFRVGSTYVAKGFSNYGSVIRVKVLGRSEQTVRVGCDILFSDSARRRINYDKDGNETLNLAKGFTLSAKDLDRDFVNIHEAQCLQDNILADEGRSDGRYDAIQDLVIEETDEGVRFRNYTKYQQAPREMYCEDWSPMDSDCDCFMVRVVNIEWQDAPVNYPTSIVAYIPEKCIDTEDEPAVVEQAVKEAMKAKGYFYYIDGKSKITYYEIEDVPNGYDFDPGKGFEIGLGGTWHY